ncbi:hypothetical protein Cni_G29398 [Canna indica]|uniref:Uncharacterized protein n=1 Tax=Canna indica TaxID=4628 RepID=A0AAQ3QTJ9_9LILI|nr:hypothetical protein Cni_G29398 [Canna indica]
MKKAIRCCIACILPCGALDVIRIVHASGRVEEIIGTVSAGEIMKAYPKHVLRKPPSPSDGHADVSKAAAVILPPDVELKKGKIYFLIPITSEKAQLRTTTTGPRTRKKEKEVEYSYATAAASAADNMRLLLNEQYLSEILSEKAPTSQRDRRRERARIWRPRLESISEVSNDL